MTSISSIQSAVCERFGVTPEELCGRSRQRRIVTARHAGIYLCRRLTKKSYLNIVRHFGMDDHTSAIHAMKQVSALLGMASIVSAIEMEAKS